MPLDTKARRFGVHGLAGLFGLALAQCGAGPDDERTASSRQAILGGSEVDGPESPVLYLESPQGACTAVLIAPNLIATARHCTATLVEGAYTCSPQCELTSTGASGAGELGADNTPSMLRFSSAAQLAPGPPLPSPLAYGKQIISTGASSVCCDDLAFVVLDRAIAGLAPAPIRIDRATQVGESVSVFGYGLTDQSPPPATVLRVRDNALVVGVGPDMGTSVTQAAPVRSLRIGSASGPPNVTCNGDSGGPIFSNATGAVIGLVSVGAQASSDGLYCSDGTDSDPTTTGPQLADYRELVLSAFMAAGASPILEESSSDAGTDGGREAESPPGADGAQPESAVDYLATGGSCATAFESRDRSGPFGPLGAIASGLAMMAVAVGRRKR